jgi:hypothetical protein
MAAPHPQLVRYRVRARSTRRRKAGFLLQCCTLLRLSEGVVTSFFRAEKPFQAAHPRKPIKLVADGVGFGYIRNGRLHPWGSAVFLRQIDRDF